MKFNFCSNLNYSRLGFIIFSNGIIKTPCFMPVGTYGLIKCLPFNGVYDLDVKIILCNSFHLMLKPGVNTIKKAAPGLKFNESNMIKLFDHKELRTIFLKICDIIYNHLLKPSHYFYNLLILNKPNQNIIQIYNFGAGGRVMGYGVWGLVFLCGIYNVYYLY